MNTTLKTKVAVVTAGVAVGAILTTMLLKKVQTTIGRIAASAKTTAKPSAVRTSCDLANEPKLRADSDVFNRFRQNMMPTEENHARADECTDECAGTCFDNECEACRRGEG